MLAASRGHLDVTASLLERAADLESKGDYDSTALMTAAFEGHRDVTAHLISSRADLEARNEDGFTALVAAAQEGQLEVYTCTVWCGRLKHNTA